MPSRVPAWESVHGHDSQASSAAARAMRHDAGDETCGAARPSCAAARSAFSSRRFHASCEREQGGRRCARPVADLSATFQAHQAKAAPYRCACIGGYARLEAEHGSRCRAARLRDRIRHLHYAASSPRTNCARCRVTTARPSPIARRNSRVPCASRSKRCAAAMLRIRPSWRAPPLISLQTHTAARSRAARRACR